MSTNAAAPHPLLGPLAETVGYHTHTISRGRLGEVSKIVEEVAELVDAERQGVKILVLDELSDLMGAVELYLEVHHPSVTLDDLIAMSAVVRRSFESGVRESAQ